MSIRASGSWPRRRAGRSSLRFVGTGADLERLARAYPEHGYSGWLDRDGLASEMAAARCWSRQPGAGTLRPCPGRGAGRRSAGNPVGFHCCFAKRWPLMPPAPGSAAAIPMRWRRCCAIWRVMMRAFAGWLSPPPLRRLWCRSPPIPGPTGWTCSTPRCCTGRRPAKPGGPAIIGQRPHLSKIRQWTGQTSGPVGATRRLAIVMR